MSIQFTCDLSYTLVYSESAGPDLQRDAFFFLPHSSFNRYFLLLLTYLWTLMLLDIDYFPKVSPSCHTVNPTHMEPSCSNIALYLSS